MAVYNSHNTKQWDELLNAINGGDTSAIATALTTIKTSIDSITTTLSSFSAEVDVDSTQWTNLITAITNQSLNVDLSNITSSVVNNLSNVSGSTTTDALNTLNSTLNDRDNFFVSDIKNFKDLANGSSVSVNITIPQIEIGIAYFIVCHCGSGKSAGGYWSVKGLVSPHSRTDISIPIPQDWDNSRIVSMPLNAINANTYNITFTNFTGVPTDSTYPSRVYAMVIKLK